MCRPVFIAGSVYRKRQYIYKTLLKKAGFNIEIRPGKGFPYHWFFLRTGRPAGPSAPVIGFPVKLHYRKDNDFVSVNRIDEGEYDFLRPHPLLPDSRFYE